MSRKALNTGAMIAQFEISEEISQDAAGFVYSGRNTSAPAGKDAVWISEFAPAGLTRRRGNKVYPNRREVQAELSQAQAHTANKFERYVKIKARGLQRGIGVIETNGTVYLVCEAVSGESIAESQKSAGKFSPGFVRSLLNDVMPGLRALSEVGLVHGGVSSSSIKRTTGGRAELLAPRLPRNRDTEIKDSDFLLDPTPFQAPEFTTALTGRIGPASDVYSLCASVYHVITGQLPPSASMRLEAIEMGEADPLNLSRLETQLEDDPGLLSALRQGLRLMVDERLPSVAKLEEAMYLTPIDSDLSDDEKSAGLAIGGAAPTWWEKFGRSLTAGGAVLLLLLISIPVFTQLATQPDDVETPVEVGPVTDAPDVDGDEEAPSVPQEAPAEPQTAPTEPSSEELVEPIEESISSSITAWNAVDQSDPKAIAAFLETEIEDDSVRSEARNLYLALEADAWRAAQDNGSVEAIEAFLDFYGDEVPSFAAHKTEADQLLARLRAEASADDVEETTTDDLADPANTSSEDTGATDIDVAEIETPPETNGEPASDSAPTEDEQPEGSPVDTPEETTPEADTGIEKDCDDCPAVKAVVLGGTDLSVAVSETTIAEFSAFLTATGRPAPTGCFTHQTGTSSVWAYNSNASYSAPGYDVSPLHPAVCVSFDEATAFASWLSQATGKTYRLLSEAEWAELAGEVPPAALACGGGNFADQSLADLDVQLNGQTCDDGQAFAAPARNGAEAIGALYGNVEEWVSDCVSGDCSKHFALGGSWASVPGQIRSNLKASYTSNSRSGTLGFRVVREN